MKKYMVLFSIITAALLAVGCCTIGNNTNSSITNESDLSANKDDLNKVDIVLDSIIEVDEELFHAEYMFNHKNLVSHKPQHSVSEDVQINKSLVLNGLNHSLKYEDTLYYPIGGNQVHRYFVDGDENKAVLIDDKGEINSILYKYTTLNVSKTASPTEVLELLKPELSKITDISYYENVKIPERAHDKEYFVGIYDYLFYNQNNGYMTDYLRVSVSGDGSVFGLSINNLTKTNLNLNVNKEKEESAIESKIKDIYNTDDTQLQSYSMSYDPCITVYENEIYIEYFISAKYTHKKHGELSSYINIILVPLSAVCN